MISATFVDPVCCVAAEQDEGVGNLTSTLKAKGLWDELVLFVTADNGAPTPSCGGAQGGQNHPLRETETLPRVCVRSCG